VANNPLSYTDPTGHYACGDGEEHDCNGHKQDPNKNPHLPKPPKSHRENTPKDEDLVENALRGISTGLDILAEVVDLYDVVVVTAGGILGAGIGLPFVEGGPEVPVVTGWAGISIAELAVQPTLQFANGLALTSTILTAAADIRSGDTNLRAGVIGKNTLNSATTTFLGYAVPEAYSSFALQSLTVANDLGWTSFPFQ
jgi:hypothetical protein